MNFQILGDNLLTYTTIITHPTAATGTNYTNVLTGSRSERFKTSSAVTTSTWAIDYGEAASPDYLYIAKAYLMSRITGDSVSVDIIGADNSGFTVNTVTQTKTFNWADKSNLYNQGNEDACWFFTFNTAKRYWKIVITTASAVIHSYSKLYFGNAFSFSREPELPLVYKPNNKITPSRRLIKDFSINFNGLWDSEVDDFLVGLATEGAYKSLIITSFDYPEIINNQSLSCVKLERFDHTANTINNNSLKLSFTEDI